MNCHIKNLDTFRAIAALVVVSGHVECVRFEKLGYSYETCFPSAHIAVMLFFVISGFLISFLLTKEKDCFNQISLKHFYLRRILRIWPLYYLVLIISSFFAEELPLKNTMYAILMLPNISHIIDCGWWISPQIWSIGVENIFYMVYPLIIMFIPRKKVLTILISFVIVFVLLPHVLDYLNVRTINNQDLTNLNYRFFRYNKFDSLAIGCIIGHLYAVKHSWLHFLYNKYVFYVSLFISVIGWFRLFDIKYFNDEFMSVLFAVVILNVCTNESLHINFENKLTKFLGKISYGIYMYHWIILLFAFKYFPVFTNTISIVLFYIFVIVTTIAVAWLSYETFEMFFLKKKKFYEKQL